MRDGLSRRAVFGLPALAALPVIDSSRFTDGKITVGQVQPLPNAFATVVLNGSGNGTAQVGPTRPREHWQVAYATVRTTQVQSQIVNEAAASAYVGSNINPSTFVSQTITASHGDACGLGNQDIQSGMQVFVQFTGGDPGATAIVNVFGTYSFGVPS